MCLGAALVGAVRLRIDPMKHSVSPVTRSDFDAVISKFRDRQISVVYYYKPEESDSSKFFEPLNAIAAELRGMFKFAAVDCDAQFRLCNDEGVVFENGSPVVMLYPLRPLSPEPFTDMDNLSDEKTGLKRALFRLLPSEHIKMLSESVLDSFLSTDEHLPKVILFSNKKASPPLFKALSTEFSKEMHFGFYPDPSDDVLRKFKLKPGQVPKIVMQESGHGGQGRKTQIYDEELSFQAIHEWINVRRETFARGGGFDHSEGTGNTGGGPTISQKPWLSQEIPEVYKQSHKDVCFKHDEGLCVIYLKEGEITTDEEFMLKSVKVAAGDEIKFRFMWMDLAKEPEFQALFAPETLPNVIVFNPHKRLRFTNPLEDPANKELVAALLDKIKAGEGRFKVVAELPEFSTRKTNEKDEL